MPGVCAPLRLYAGMRNLRHAAAEASDSSLPPSPEMKIEGVRIIHVAMPLIYPVRLHPPQFLRAARVPPPHPPPPLHSNI